jgi:phenylalanyl-tRNA synthetase alpha chain
MTNPESQNLDQSFAQLEAEARQAAAGLNSPEAVENFRLEWLGRKQGRLKLLSDQWLKSAPVEAKARDGSALQCAQDPG